MAGLCGTEVGYKLDFRGKGHRGGGEGPDSEVSFDVPRGPEGSRHRLGLELGKSSVISAARGETTWLCEPATGPPCGPRPSRLDSKGRDTSLHLHRGMHRNEGGGVVKV